MRYDNFWCSVGVHPDNEGVTEPSVEALVERSRRGRVVAIGETGLDYYYDHSPRETQREAFARFVELARSVNKPVVCHIRDAHDDAREAVASPSPCPLEQRDVIVFLRGTWQIPMSDEVS